MPRRSMRLGRCLSPASSLRPTWASSWASCSTCPITSCERARARIRARRAILGPLPAWTVVCTPEEAPPVPHEGWRARRRQTGSAQCGRWCMPPCFFAVPQAYLLQSKKQACSFWCVGTAGHVLACLLAAEEDTMAEAVKQDRPRSVSPASLEDRLAQLEQVVQSQQQLVQNQQQRLAQQDAEIAQLRAIQHDDPAEHAPALVLPVSIRRAADDDQPTRHRSSRRALLKLGGVAAAAAGVATVAAVATDLAHPGTAHAHFDGATETQTAVNAGNWAIEADGSSGADGLHANTDSGTAVVGVATSGVGVFGQSSFGYGVSAFSSTNVAVHGSSSTYVGVAGFGFGSNGVGGWFVGPRAALALSSSAGGPGAPTTGQHFQGDIYVDSNITLWVCIADGTPGTWCRVTCVANGTAGGATTYLMDPVRLLDARGGANSGLVNRGALAGNELYNLSVAGLGGSGIPSGAQGLICNVTVLGPGGNGNLSLFPAGPAPPTTASMTFLAGPSLANGVN